MKHISTTKQATLSGIQRNSWQLFLFATLLLLTLPTYVTAEVLVDTGPASTSTIGGSSLFSTGSTTCSPQPSCASSFQNLAGQFTLANEASLSSVEGWMSGIFKGSIEIKIRADNAGIPGAVIFSKTYSPRSQSVAVNWVLFESYNTVLAAGKYWLSFEPLAGSEFQTAMPKGALNPLQNYAFFSDGNNQWRNYGAFGPQPGFGMRISGTSTPVPQTICGGLPPAGYITVSVDGICRREGLTSYIGRTIRKIEGLPTDSTINTCGDVAPPGWITTEVADTPCARVGLASYIGRTIRKIEGLPANSTINTCGDVAPPGWITTAVTDSQCARVGLKSYIGRTIRKIEGLPTDSTINTCGDVAPSGWITTAVADTPCARAGLASYIGRTIRKIQGLPTDSTINTCGDVAPPGWITTAIRSQSCARVGLTSFISRTIRKIEGLPINSIVSVCGDLPPAGWTTVTTTGNCARFGLTFYTGRTIEKIND